MAARVLHILVIVIYKIPISHLHLSLFSDNLSGLCMTVDMRSSIFLFVVGISLLHYFFDDSGDNYILNQAKS